MSIKILSCSMKITFFRTIDFMLIAIHSINYNIEVYIHKYMQHVCSTDDG